MKMDSATTLSPAAKAAPAPADTTEIFLQLGSITRLLHDTLKQKMPGRDFGYFLSQRGMFSYTGLDPRQVDRLREEFAVYLVRSGRLCVAGLNTGNVEATGLAMAAVLDG